MLKQKSLLLLYFCEEQIDEINVKPLILKSLFAYLTSCNFLGLTNSISVSISIQRFAYRVLHFCLVFDTKC